jgi:hypothetical protein
MNRVVWGITPKHKVMASSQYGRISMHYIDVAKSPFNSTICKWRNSKSGSRQVRWHDYFAGLFYFRMLRDLIVAMPYCFPALLVTFCGVTPRLVYRLSLRTLLVAMPLIDLILGTIATVRSCDR